MSLFDRARYALYAQNFFFFFSIVVITFFATPYLSAYGVPHAAIGYAFAAAYILGTLLLYVAERIVLLFGSFTTFVSSFAILAATYALMPAATTPGMATLGFIIVSVLTLLIAHLFDSYLEQATPSVHTTGRVRATFLTMSNIAWIGVPIVGGLLLFGESYTRLFVITAVLLLPVIVLAYIFLKPLPSVDIHALDVRRFMHRLRTNSDLARIFMAQWGLRVFYGGMSAYAPLFLMHHLGFSLAEMGVIFTLSQIPLLVLDLPLGYFADTRWGEKEMLIVGYIILIITTGALTFITSTTLLVWALALGATRIGAAMIETGTESYFFKHVGSSDADAMSAFRMLFPLGYVAGPLIMGGVLLFAPLAYTYLALACVFVIPLYALRSLRDTR